MGYTHYWTVLGSLSQEQKQGIANDAIKIIETAGEQGIRICYDHDEPHKDPVVTADEIWLNGVQHEGHETFYFDPTKRNWQFCKTARKPYDAVVGAILLSALNHAPKLIRVSSDGEEKDWAAPFTLYREALDTTLPANTASIFNEQEEETA